MAIVSLLVVVVVLLADGDEPDTADDAAGDATTEVETRPTATDPPVTQDTAGTTEVTVGGTGGPAPTAKPPIGTVGTVTTLPPMPTASEAAAFADAYLDASNRTDPEGFADLWTIPAQRYDEWVTTRSTVVAAAEKFYARYPVREFNRTGPVTVSGDPTAPTLSFDYEYYELLTDGTTRCGVNRLVFVTTPWDRPPLVASAQEPPDLRRPGTC